MPDTTIENPCICCFLFAPMDLWGYNRQYRIMPRGEHLQKIEDDEILAEFDEERLGRRILTAAEITRGGDLPVTAEAVRKRLQNMTGEEVEKTKIGGTTLWYRKGEKVFITQDDQDYRRVRAEAPFQGPIQVPVDEPGYRLMIGIGKATIYAGQIMVVFILPGLLSLFFPDILTAWPAVALGLSAAAVMGGALVYFVLFTLYLWYVTSDLRGSLRFVLNPRLDAAGGEK